MTAAISNADQPALGADMKFHDASRMFSEALRRILTSAGESEEGNLTSLSQMKLSEGAGVGRSTLAKYLTATTDHFANPTLEVICRLAHSLGVPPAFLLMTADDWTRLAISVDYYAKICQVEKFCDFADRATHPNSRSNHQEIAEAGLQIGGMLGLLERPDSDSDPEMAASQRASVAATCLAPPFSALDTKYRPILFTLCAIIGASTSH
jgi:transcriptional regulator with XRE-family HTH domain